MSINCIWALNVTEIDKHTFQLALNRLPIEKQQDILRYHQFIDRKLKLYGRLLIQSYCKQNRIPFNWSSWTVSKNGKPKIPSIKFNISHSGNWVIVAFSELEIGIDIEQENEIDFNSLIHQFHPEEQQAFELSENKKECFYSIWTRKEAFLKAKAIGIVDGLDHENCLNDSIIKNGVNWYINTIDFDEEYSVAIAYNSVLFKEFLIKEINWLDL